MSHTFEQRRHEYLLPTACGPAAVTLTGLPDGSWEAVADTAAHELVRAVDFRAKATVDRLARLRDPGDLVLTYLILLAVGESAAVRNYLARAGVATASLDEDISRLDVLQKQLACTPEEVLALVT